jgi:hypothetical protein
MFALSINKNLIPMKRFLIAAAVLAVVISAASCKKCTTCKYDYFFSGDTVHMSYPQECGKNSEIKDFKAEKESEAQMHGVELQCTDD